MLRGKSSSSGIKTNTARMAGDLDIQSSFFAGKILAEAEQRKTIALFHEKFMKRKLAELFISLVI